MTTTEERTELVKEPLPICDEDRSIPTRIAELDSQIYAIKLSIGIANEKISGLMFDRESLLKRAKEVHVVEDKQFKIVEIPVYKKNFVRVDILQMEYRDIYDKVMWGIAQKLTEKHNAEFEKYKTFIPQADVKAVTTDKMVLAKVIPPNTEIEGVVVSLVRK